MLDPNNHDNNFDYIPRHYYDHDNDYYRWDHMHHPHRHDHREDSYDNYYWWNRMYHPYDYDNYYEDEDYSNYPYFGAYPRFDYDVIETLAPVGDPPPKLSNNPPITSITLTKELTAYPNYGNPSGNADILYTGNRGSWTFMVPPTAFTTGRVRGILLISAALDDHNDVAVRDYSAKISINGIIVHDGPLPLAHGMPAGGKFDNWKILRFNISNVKRNTRVTIENTSKTGNNDFIALDYMEIKLS